MSRSFSAIAARWYCTRCAVAVLITLTAHYASAAAPGNPLARFYRSPQTGQTRVAQMQAEQSVPAGDQGEVFYDDNGPSAMAPTPAEGYRGGNMGGGNYGGGMPSGSCGGCGNPGCNGSCGCGDCCRNGAMIDNYGGYGGGCGDGYCGGYCGDDCGYGCNYGCYGGCGDGCYDNFCGLDCNIPRCSFYVDWLSLQVTDADVAHAQQQDGIGGAGTVPFGQIGTVDIDYDSGVRFGGSIGCGQCAGVTWSITNFESYNENHLSPPVNTNTGAVGSLVQHPGAAITASAGPVDAAYDIDFRMADLMYRHFLTGGPCYAVNYEFGVQYGHLEQFFIQEGIFSGGQSGTIDTFTNIDFDGGGVKAGLDAERQLCWGFMTYARATAAIMTGRFSSRYDMVNTTTEVLLARSRWKDDRVVPHLEYELGIGWASPSGHWRFSTGYMLSHWANVVTTPEFIDAVQADNYTNVEGDLTFDGAVTRAEIRW